MISAKDEEVLRVFDFVCKEETDRFEGLFSSIHIISQEKVVCFWRETAVLKESEEVVILPMYITWER